MVITEIPNIFIYYAIDDKAEEAGDSESDGFGEADEGVDEVTPQVLYDMYDTLTIMQDKQDACINLLLFADVLIALTIGVVCASILSKYLHVRG